MTPLVFIICLIIAFFAGIVFCVATAIFMENLAELQEHRTKCPNLVPPPPGCSCPPYGTPDPSEMEWPDMKPDTQEFIPDILKY